MGLSRSEWGEPPPSPHARLLNCNGIRSQRCGGFDLGLGAIKLGSAACIAWCCAHGVAWTHTHATHPTPTYGLAPSLQGTIQAHSEFEQRKREIAEESQVVVLRQKGGQEEGHDGEHPNARRARARRGHVPAKVVQVEGIHRHAEKGEEWTVATVLAPLIFFDAR